MKSQKESLGEYGSGWEWEENTYAHVFDQESNDGIPKKYYSDGMTEGVCTGNLDYTNGQILFSLSQMTNQVSCRPHSSNTGNYYSFPGATAGSNITGGNAPNSVCSKGWMLSANAVKDQKSYYSLIRNIYSISDSKDGKIRPLPMSFIRSGWYYWDGNPINSGQGNYIESTAASSSVYHLVFANNRLNPINTYNKNVGYSLRCVGEMPKESLGEYGSGWGWESNTYAHILDQTDSAGVPLMYNSNGLKMDACLKWYIIANGEILSSLSLMSKQVSCMPSTSSAGNYYSWPAATAGGNKTSGDEHNSICAKGWSVPTYMESSVLSFYNLIRVSYAISGNGDSVLRLLPFSFIRSGAYHFSNLDYRGGMSLYWSSSAYDTRNNSAHGALNFMVGSPYPNDYGYQDDRKNYGYSLRCVEIDKMVMV